MEYSIIIERNEDKSLPLRFIKPMSFDVEGAKEAANGKIA